MKLFRFGVPGAELPGAILDGGPPRDVSSLVRDYDERFFAQGGLPYLQGEMLRRQAELPQLELSALRLGAPIARPSKIIGIGLNYRDHALETAAALPREPKIFMKASSAMCGVNDVLQLPRGAECTDYEVELAVVIARRASYVSEVDALHYVAGYTICNDYSEREFQKNREGQFVKGKSADTFCPLGPVLVTADEGHFGSARLWCDVNGERRQDSTTAQMVFAVPALIASLSQYMTLLPGDVITTGTPAGVGLGFTPPRYLKDGDVVAFGIDGIGQGTMRVQAYQKPALQRA